MPFLIAAFETAMAAEAAAAVAAASMFGAEVLGAAAVPELAAVGAEALGTAGTAAAIPEAAMGINAINPELYASAVNSGAVNPATAFNDIPGLADKLANLQPGEAFSNPNALAEANRFGASPMASGNMAGPGTQVTASASKGIMPYGAPPAPPAATPLAPAGSTSPVSPAFDSSAALSANGLGAIPPNVPPIPPEPPGFFDKLSNALSPLQKGFQTAQKFVKENPLASGLGLTAISRMGSSGDSMPDTTYNGPLSKYKLSPNFKGRFADPRSFRTAASGGIIDYKEGGTTEKPLVHANMGIAIDDNPQTNKLSPLAAARKRAEELKKRYGISIPEMQAPTPIDEINVGPRTAAHGGIMQVKRFMEGGGGDGGGGDGGGGGGDGGGGGYGGDAGYGGGFDGSGADVGGGDSSADASSDGNDGSTDASSEGNGESSDGGADQAAAIANAAADLAAAESAAPGGVNAAANAMANAAANLAAAESAAPGGVNARGTGLFGSGPGGLFGPVNTGGLSGYSGPRDSSFDGGGAGSGIDSVESPKTLTKPKTNIDNLKPKHVNPKDFRSSLKTSSSTTDPYEHYKNYNDADYNYLRTPSMPVRNPITTFNTPPSNAGMTDFFSKFNGVKNPNKFRQPDYNPPNYNEYDYDYLFAQGGILGINPQGGMSSLGGYARGGMPRLLDGPGDGMSDNIPATINDRQPARLADGEFVVPADVVSHLGNGSTKAGSKRLHLMMDQVRRARTGNPKQGKRINPDKFMPK